MWVSAWMQAAKREYIEGTDESDDVSREFLQMLMFDTSFFRESRWKERCPRVSRRNVTKICWRSKANSLRPTQSGKRRSKLPLSQPSD